MSACGRYVRYACGGMCECMWEVYVSTRGEVCECEHMWEVCQCIYGRCVHVCRGYAAKCV